VSKAVRRIAFDRQTALFCSRVENVGDGMAGESAGWTPRTKKKLWVPAVVVSTLQILLFVRYGLIGQQ
jgi:hypothetical protein